MQENFSVIKELRGKVIVSSQAAKGEPFYSAEKMSALIESVLLGGADGLRLAGESHIKEARKLTTKPIIGITKPDIIPPTFRELVYITPTFDDAKIVRDAGADIVAIDGTSRPRPKEDLSTLVTMIHEELKCPVMADISTIDEAINVVHLGVDIVSTTLAGYTTYTQPTKGPDFALLKEIVATVKTPVILEGRIETEEDVEKAFELGAWAVVIGSVITRPHLVTQKFVEASRRQYV